MDKAFMQHNTGSGSKNHFALLPNEVACLVLEQATGADMICHGFHLLSSQHHLQENMAKHIQTKYLAQGRFNFVRVRDVIECLRILMRGGDIFLSSDTDLIKMAKTGIFIQQLFEIMLCLTLNNVMFFTLPTYVRRRRYQPGANGFGMYYYALETDYFYIAKENFLSIKQQFAPCFSLLRDLQIDSFNFHVLLKAINDQYHVLVESYDREKPYRIIEAICHFFSSQKKLTSAEKIRPLMGRCLARLNKAVVALNEIKAIATLPNPVL